MDDKEFMNLANALGEYLEKPKVFVKNPQRIAEVEQAITIAEQLFPTAKITIKDDPLQMGALILCVEDFDISIGEIELFCAMVDKANNFSIYPKGNEAIQFSIVFNKALHRIHN